MNAQPLLVYSVAIGDEDPRYDAQSDAYGLEMAFDDEWPVEMVICTTPKCVAAIAANTSVTSAGVSIGTNSLPQSPHFAANATWIVLDANDARKFDIANTRFKCIIHSANDGRLIEYIDSHSAAPSSLKALAIHATVAEGLGQRVHKIRDSLNEHQMSDVRIIVYIASSDLNIGNATRIDGVNGLFHPSARYDEILEWIPHFRS